MLTFARYERPSTPEEALSLLRSKRGSKIMGGGLWMRLSKRTYPCVIDLTDCGLDTIEETEDAYRIGAMVTLRQLECDARLNLATGNVLNAAVHDIVGVQFRQLATVGGSVYGRFGFSDVICALLALDSEVELVDAGRMPLAAFLAEPPSRDVLTHVVVRKHDYAATYEGVRKAATDFSTLNVCAAHWDGVWHLSVGARPGRAHLLAGDELGCRSAAPTPDELARAMAAARALTFSSNLWGSARYREHLAGVLAGRALVGAARFETEDASRAAHDAVAQAAAVPSAIEQEVRA